MIYDELYTNLGNYPPHTNSSSYHLRRLAATLTRDSAQRAPRSAHAAVWGPRDSIGRGLEKGKFHTFLWGFNMGISYDLMGFIRFMGICWDWLGFLLVAIWYNYTVHYGKITMLVKWWIINKWVISADVSNEGFCRYLPRKAGTILWDMLCDNQI